MINQYFIFCTKWGLHCVNKNHSTVGCSWKFRFLHIYFFVHTEIEPICELACGAHLTYLLWSIWYNANTVTPLHRLALSWKWPSSDLRFGLKHPILQVTYIFLSLKKYCALQMLFTKSAAWYGSNYICEVIITQFYESWVMTGHLYCYSTGK